MQLTDDDIKNFQALCEKEFGVKLSEQDAAGELRALVTLVRILLRIE